MQIGNPKALDAAREAMRDAFDAIWLASSEIGPKESRAIKCAAKLDRRISLDWNKRIHVGGYSFPSGEIVRRGRSCYPVIYA